jgi:hypothetical protein
MLQKSPAVATGARKAAAGYLTMGRAVQAINCATGAIARARCWKAFATAAINGMGGKRQRRIGRAQIARETCNLQGRAKTSTTRAMAAASTDQYA